MQARNIVHFIQSHKKLLMRMIIIRFKGFTPFIGNIHQLLIGKVKIPHCGLDAFMPQQL